MMDIYTRAHASRREMERKGENRAAETIELLTMALNESERKCLELERKVSINNGGFLKV